MVIDMTSEIGTVKRITQDPNFMLILGGAALWFFGYYVILFSSIFIVAGFTLTVYATAVTAPRRPLEGAWAGAGIGIAIYIIGDLVQLVPILQILHPALTVCGSTLILFFITAIAVQRGNEELAEALKRVSESARAGTRKRESAKSDDADRDTEDTHETS